MPAFICNSDTTSSYTLTALLRATIAFMQFIDFVGIRQSAVCRYFFFLQIFQTIKKGYVYYFNIFYDEIFQTLTCLPVSIVIFASIENQSW